MRIGIVSDDSALWRPALDDSDDLRADGRARTIHGSATALAEFGAEVTVYLRRDFASSGAGQKTNGVRTVFVEAGPPQPVPPEQIITHAATLGHGLADLWSEQPPDVVHAYGWIAGTAAHVGAADLGLPIVQSLTAFRRATPTPGGRQLSPEGQARLRLERSLACSAAHVITTSTGSAFELSRLGVPQRRSAVVPPGVDADVFARTGDAGVLERRTFRILVVSDLERTTAVERVLAAVAVLRDSEVMIVGGPSGRDLMSHLGARRVRAVAAQLGILDRVEIRGHIDHGQMPTVYRNADAVVSLPETDGVPVSALEAMAAGRPIVAATTAGLVDLVIDGITGLHVPPRDPLSLVEALRRLRNDPVLRDSMGLAGSDRARTRYAWPRIAAETYRVYTAVAQRPTIAVDVR